MSELRQPDPDELTHASAVDAPVRGGAARAGSGALPAATGAARGPRADRLLFIDALRGFALFGVFGANLLIFSGFTFLPAAQQARLSGTPWDRAAHALLLFFVDTKFIGLFSVLFGISFWLFLDRGGAERAPRTSLFYRRIGWLFVIGALHGWLLWLFDVLRFYALWALLLPLFVRTPVRRLLAIALSTAILLPALVAGLHGVIGSRGSGLDYDAIALAAFASGSYTQTLIANWQYDWHLTLTIGQVGYQAAVFGRLLLGLYIARTIAFDDLDAHRRLLVRVLLAGAAAGIAGNAIFTGGYLSGAGGVAVPFLRRLVVEAGFLGFTLAYASGLALLFRHDRWIGAFRALAPVGRMALTWYLCQTVFGIWLFYGWPPGPRLMGQLGPAWLTIVWIIGFAIQVLLAGVWMRRFHFGPAEWLWRSLTYARRQPWRRSEVTA